MIKTIQAEVKKRLGLNSECSYDEDDLQYHLQIFNIDAATANSIIQKIEDLTDELFPEDPGCICPFIYNKAETRRFFTSHAVS